jgi:hypothetical protein
MTSKKSQISSSASKSKPEMPKLIFAQASPHSIGGVSMFDAGSGITSETFANFHSEETMIHRAVEMLRQAGFQILQVTGATINIAGTQQAYEEAFNTKLTLEQRKVIKPKIGEDLAEFVECPETDLPGLISTKSSCFSEVLEGVAKADA